jgi:heme-degrading monooxygenase HmoA
MFIAMNRFRVKRSTEDAFEKVWLSRDSYLERVPGFVEFHLLKGPEAEDHTLYASHTVWQSKAAFEAWTKSEEFRAAHARAGNDTTGPLYLEHPKFEGFEVRQTVTHKAAVGDIVSDHLSSVGQTPRARLDSIDPFSYRNGIVAPVRATEDCALELEAIRNGNRGRA